MLLTTIEADGDALRLLRLPERRSSSVNARASGATPPSRPTRGDDRRSPLFAVIVPAAAQLAAAYRDLPTAWPRSAPTTFGQDALGLHQYAVARDVRIHAARVARQSRRTCTTAGTACCVDRNMTREGNPGRRDRGLRDLRRARSGSRPGATSRSTAGSIGAWAARSSARSSIASGASDANAAGRAGARPGRRRRYAAHVSGCPRARAPACSCACSRRPPRGCTPPTPATSTARTARLHFPLGKTVLSLRWNEAWGESDAEPFQLGGSVSDPPTLLPILNQREFALRGYTSGEPTLTGNRARIDHRRMAHSVVGRRSARHGAAGRR